MKEERLLLHRPPLSLKRKRKRKKEKEKRNQKYRARGSTTRRVRGPTLGSTNVEGDFHVATNDDLPTRCEHLT